MRSPPDRGFLFIIPHILTVVSTELHTDPHKSDWRIDHHVAAAFLPLPSNRDDDVFMTRPWAERREGREEAKERAGGNRQRERETWTEVLF